jgi:hypothetical protein
MYILLLGDLTCLLLFSSFVTSSFSLTFKVSVLALDHDGFLYHVGGGREVDPVPEGGEGGRFLTSLPVTSCQDVLPLL